MARVRIDDLPPVQDLTPEELAAIFRAGLRTRLGVEGLETRDLLTASVFQPWTTAYEQAVRPGTVPTQATISADLAASDGARLLKLTGTGGAGANMYAVNETDSGFATV